MMRRNWWSLLLVGVALLIAVPNDAFAQRRGGGSRRSSPSRSSKPRASKPRASKPRASKPPRGKAGGKASKKKGQYGSSKRKAGKSKKVTKADVKAYEKAKLAGKTATDRKGAMKKFSSNPANAKKYTSTYASKPENRPGHIPRTYVGSGGTTYNISYNQGYGGYGYMGSGGSWIVYNAMADVAMAGYYNRQMASAGYIYGPRPVVAHSYFFIQILIGVAVLIAAFAFFGRNSVKEHRSDF